MDTLDVAVTVKSDHLTPHKKVPSIFNDESPVVILFGISFGSGRWWDGNSCFRPWLSSSSSFLFSRIDNLYITTEELRKGVVEKNINLAGRVQSFGAEVVLLGDHIGCDPSLTDIPLRYTWEGIAWVKASIGNTFQAASPQLQNSSPPISVQEVQQMVSSSLLPSAN